MRKICFFMSWVCDFAAILLLVFVPDVSFPNLTGGVAAGEVALMWPFALIETKRSLMTAESLIPIGQLAAVFALFGAVLILALFILARRRSAVWMSVFATMMHVASFVCIVFHTYVVSFNINAIITGCAISGLMLVSCGLLLWTDIDLWRKRFLSNGCGSCTKGAVML